MLLRLYHLIAQPIRLLFYRLLLPIGEHLYSKGTYHVPNVQRLPFNLYLKHFRLLRAQYEAHAPRVFNLIELPAKNEGWISKG